MRVLANRWPTGSPPKATRRTRPASSRTSVYRSPHDFRDATPASPARRIAQCRACADLAGKRTRVHGSNAEAIIFAEHQTLSAGNVTVATSSAGCGSSTMSTGRTGSRRSARSTRCCARKRASPISISRRATSTGRRSKSWRAAPRRPNLPSPNVPSRCPSRPLPRAPIRRISASSWPATVPPSWRPTIGYRVPFKSRLCAPTARRPGLASSCRWCSRLILLA